MTGLNDFLVAPLFDGTLLTRALVLFTLFLLAVRFLPGRGRNQALLAASLALIAIATSPLYTLGFLSAGTGLYFLILRITPSPRRKTYASILAAGFILFYFLCLDWKPLASPWTGSMVHRFGIAYSLFRFLSVILDAGRGKPLPTGLLNFLVYLFFLPTFFQGPIERLDEFCTNLNNCPHLTWSETGANLIRILGAFVKGWVVIRFLELDWRQYFDYPQQYSYGFLLWGMYARTIGFYLFVSAANDFTIACCGLAGYCIHENYDYPYFKKNLAQFWRSWHMTLVRFLRDYVYIPLGGNRRHVHLNYLIIFMAIALWHVTSPAFVLWGLWHGVGMCLLRWWQNFWKRIDDQKVPGTFWSLQQWGRQHPTWVKTASTLFTFHYVALGWLPFWGGHPQGLSMVLRLVSGNRWRLFEW